MNTTYDIHQKKQLQPLLLLSASLLLSLMYIPPVDMFYDDKEIFGYAGMLMSKGGVPYRDLFDHKPPLIFFLNYFGPWGLWLIDTTLVTLATWLFFQTCRQYKLAFAWLLPLLFNLLIRNYLVCFGVGMTRAYTAIFQLIFFCLLLGNNRLRYFWMGLLTALILFMQQDQILPLLPFLAYTLFSETTARRWGHLAIGFILTTTLILSYFSLHHSLAIFWKDALSFNLSWYTHAPPSAAERYRSIKSGLHATDSEMPLLIALTLGCAALLTKGKGLTKAPTNKRLLIATLLSTFLAFSPQYLSGKAGPAFYYYYLPLSAAIPLLTFAAFQQNSFLTEKKLQALFGFLLCILPLYNALQHATHLSLKNKDMVEAYPEFKYLEQQPFAQNHEDYKLYILGDNNWVYAYNKFHILSPSHWIYHQFWAWYDGWDASHKELDRIMIDLRGHRTRYIIYYSDFDWRDQSARSKWEAFLHQYYVQVSVPGSWKNLLWELRE
ncbi:MAG: hypothetical protein JST68_27490 [Bacteroidetes bacterium]|nr:hypothetical protein [Bacteroidota bacterium]